MDKPREIALKILYQMEEKDAYSNIILKKELKRACKILEQRDTAFISEIVYGTLTWQLTIDAIIQKYSKIRMKKISPWILAILRLSIYQIVFLDKVPKSAAVNEGVNLAKRYGHKASSNFVNAILRKVDKEDYQVFYQIENPVERLAKTTSMPQWIIEKLLTQKPYEEVEKICQASCLRPKLFIRINTLKIDKANLIKELEKENIKVEQSDRENFLQLEGTKNIEELKAFQQGLFTVQDEAAGDIAKMLNPKPNEKVLDACSSPGGKTTYLAEIMKNEGEIIAWDLYEHRVKLVEQAAKRLGIRIIQSGVKDATRIRYKPHKLFRQNTVRFTMLRTWCY